MQNHIQSLCNEIADAYQSRSALNIRGGGSKLFYGNEIDAEQISTSNLSGIIEYQPSELYISAYSGTPLSEIETALIEHNQMLSFEPPSYTNTTTFGGTVACGLSGPRRPYADAMRDCVLGTHVINGKGEHLTFGGKVMKNVAGYDVSRLMCGAFGTLGLITQLSVKVLPKPHAEITLVFECDEQQAIKQIHSWLNSLIPITATYHHDKQLYIRVAGLEKNIENIQHKIGGEIIPSSDNYWQSIKNHQSSFFATNTPLYKCIVPPNSPTIKIEGECCFEWNGGLRWIKSHESFNTVINQCTRLRGHATLFKSKNKPTDCLNPMNNHLKQLHLNLKQAFDPASILNPGRMYSWC